MPCKEDAIAQFLDINKSTMKQKEETTLQQLNQEASNNQKLIIKIASNIIC